MLLNGRKLMIELKTLRTLAKLPQSDLENTGIGISVANYSDASKEYLLEKAGRKSRREFSAVEVSMLSYLRILTKVQQAEIAQLIDDRVGSQDL
jgi:hypothetical protein